MPASGTQWTIGLGAGAVPEYQGGDDYHAVPLWNVRAQKLYHPDTYAQLIGIENADGSNYNDAIYGDDQANRLGGAGGDDLIGGRVGDDVLAGGLGNDRLFGDEGFDLADYAAG